MALNSSDLDVGSTLSMRRSSPSVQQMSSKIRNTRGSPGNRCCAESSQAEDKGIRSLARCNVVIHRRCYRLPVTQMRNRLSARIWPRAVIS